MAIQSDGSKKMVFLSSTGGPSIQPDMPPLPSLSEAFSVLGGELDKLSATINALTDRLEPHLTSQFVDGRRNEKERALPEDDESHAALTSLVLRDTQAAIARVERLSDKVRDLYQNIVV